MNKTLNKALLPLLALSAALAVLVGCAAEKNFRNADELLKANRVDDALAEYRQALREEPTNARYRIAYLNARDKSAQQWLDQAEKIRGDVQRGNEARALYQRVLDVDPENSRAREGLVEIEREQRINETVARARTDAAQGNVTLALAGLRSVLADRPQHAAALALQTQLLEQRAKPKAALDAKLAEAYRRPISLEFRDAQLKQVFEVLSRSSGLNFVLDKDVRGDQRTTLFLRNSTIADALSLALLTNQLEQRVLDANSVLIFPNTPAKVREYQQLSVKAFVLSSSDTKTVSNSLKTLLKAKDLVIDEKQNMIVMRDSPEAIELAEKIVALHDQPEAEVMLDVEILEVKRERLVQMGVQYPSQVALAPMTAASGAQVSLSDLRHLRGATTSVTGANIGLQASQTDSDVNVLANPRIRSRNREKAKIQVGQRVPNITSTSTSTGFVAETVQYVEVGLKLEVEPTVSPDGEVAIKVGLEVSNILRQVQTKGGSIAYEIGTRNANTVLRLRDGENQVLAGLINDEDRRSVTGLPGLVAAPGLGGTLFGATNNDRQKSEIVLSITPRIIRSAFRPDLAIGEFMSGTEANLRSRGLGLGGGASSPPPSNPAATGQAAPKPPASPEGSAVATPPSAVPAASAPAAAEEAAPAPPPAPMTNATESTPGPQNWPSGLSWRGPSAVAPGSTLTLELWAQSSQPLSVVPLALSYDPRILSPVSVDQGNYMSNAGTTASLNKRADPGSGVIRAVLSSTGSTGSAAEGSLLRLAFKALAASDGTTVSVSEPVQAVSPSGEAVVLTMPPTWNIRVK